MVDVKKPTSSPKPKTASNIFEALYHLLYIMLVRFPLFLRLWIVTLISINMAGAYFWDTIEGKVSVIVFNVGAMLMSALYMKYGFAKILGVGHIGWVALVPWFAFFRIEQAEDPALKTWMTLFVIINSMSLGLDMMDVYHFSKGKTVPTIVW